MSNKKQAGFATRAVRAGIQRTQEGEHSPAIFATSSFVFDSAEHAAARFSGEEEGNIYSRFTNPTVRVFEERLATLEQANWAIGTGSGMAAVMITCLGLLKQGDHLVTSRSVFGSIHALFEKHLPNYGIEVSFVELSDPAAWRDAIQPNTKLLFLETPSNPLTELADIAELAELAHANDAFLAVDNCFATPVLQNPLPLGADIVVHSATKYLDGQGRCIGGAVLGQDDELRERIFGFHRNAGAALSPFNAWVFLKGLETLSVRVRAQCASAATLAAWLDKHPNVEKVHYPGLSSHPQHELCAKQQSGFGAICTFEVKGGQAAAWRVIDGTQMLSITANLGDARTTITHPATTTHGKIGPQARQQSGVVDGLIRIAVGLEDVADIIADLQTGID